jgi:hypothetical protein
MVGREEVADHCREEVADHGREEVADHFIREGKLINICPYPVGLGSL